MEEEQGIYRGEVTTMMGILADINVMAILAYIRGEDDDEEEDRPSDA
jgi:hypothetical protein